MLVANTTLLKLVENWTTLETSLGAIARLKTLEVMTVREGDDACPLEPAEIWPSKGHIEFKNVTASYRQESDVIRDFSLNITPGQKVIVCGRTGSGKSTLLLTLLRLLELKSGSIKLDDLDIKQVGLDLLRKRCFVVVSQDDLLLPNETLRFNLNPHESAPDNAIVDALTKAGLHSHFFDRDTDSERDSSRIIDMSTFGEHSVLDRQMSHFRELSVGQCQLFAVYRALIKACLLRGSGVKPVIVLDEVTSSLDSDTESIIYHTIDDEFTENGHTVIIIAHRLGDLEKHTKNGRDCMVFMADGRLQDVIRDLRPETFQRLRQVE